MPLNTLWRVKPVFPCRFAVTESFSQLLGRKTPFSLRISTFHKLFINHFWSYFENWTFRSLFRFQGFKIRHHGFLPESTNSFLVQNAYFLNSLVTLAVIFQFGRFHQRKVLFYDLNRRCRLNLLTLVNFSIKTLPYHFLRIWAYPLFIQTRYRFISWRRPLFFLAHFGHQIDIHVLIRHFFFDIAFARALAKTTILDYFYRALFLIFYLPL